MAVLPNLKSKKAPWVVPSFEDDFNFQKPFINTATKGECSSASTESEHHIASAVKVTTEKSFKTLMKKHSSKRTLHNNWSDEVINKEELSVHKKKIQEVEEWLIKAFTGVKGYRMLLLTGPAGAGKTACVRALAAEMGLNVKEWINATNTPYSADTQAWQADSSGIGWVPGDSVTELSQVAQFRDFVTRVNKYGTVATTETSSVGPDAASLLLVEDIPNAFYRSPAQFHDVLRRYSVCGRAPSIFILSDSPQQEHSARNLFPPHIHDACALTNIQFNPIAATLMSKALSNLCARRGVQADPTLLSSLATAAAGDVRTAVNALHFTVAAEETDPHDALFCRSTSKRRKISRSTCKGVSKGKEKSRNSQQTSLTEDSLIAIGGKDTSLLMFRALGKVLYCKRTDDPPIALPSHLRREERAPCLEDAEAVLDKCCLTPATFLAFLHQNYSSFMPGIEAATKTLEYLADADTIMGHWMERDSLSVYCTVGVRGLMHATGTPSGGGHRKPPSFRPLTSPAYTDVTRAAAARLDDVRHAFRRHDVHDLVTHVIPYMARIQRDTYSPTSQLVQEVGLLSSATSSAFAATFRSGGGGAGTLSNETNVAAAEAQTELELDYEVNIEEFDD